MVSSDPSQILWETKVHDREDSFLLFPPNQRENSHPKATRENKQKFRPPPVSKTRLFFGHTEKSLLAAKHVKLRIGVFVINKIRDQITKPIRWSSNNKEYFP